MWVSGSTATLLEPPRILLLVVVKIIPDLVLNGDVRLGANLEERWHLFSVQRWIDVDGVRKRRELEGR